MADPNDKIDLSPAVIQKAAQMMMPHPGEASVTPKKSDFVISPLTKAFGELSSQPASRYNLVGTAPLTYQTKIDNNSNPYMDGNRGIELSEKGNTDVRFMAGSYTPTSGAPVGTERYTAGVAWTPLNVGSLKVGPMLGDVAQINPAGNGAKPFERVGLSAGVYATMEDKNGSGAFAKIETDPTAGGKPRVHLGLKSSF